MVMNTENQDILRITSAVMQGCQQLSCFELLKLKILLKEKDMCFEKAIKVSFHVNIFTGYSGSAIVDIKMSSNLKLCDR